MKRPKICAVLVTEDSEAITATEPLVELFEVRIDLIGDAWQQVARQLKRPWIACNRRAAEGGSWRGNETDRIEKLVKAAELGASIVDIELATKNLTGVIPVIKRKAKCLLSFHNLEKTPSLDMMKRIVNSQLEAGADICKVITTGQRFEDNLTVLQLIADFPQTKIVSFAMGPLGLASRILCPLVGGEFTYASTEEGKESAPGQITVKQLRKIYGMVSG
jgi:3-dehydroquinate dehydratase type I